MVRVYPACDGHCPASALTVRLSLLKDGQEQTSLTRTLPAQSLSQINSLSLPELRAKLENSVNFEFFPPPDWLVGSITFVVEVVPSDPTQTLPAALTLTRAGM